MTCQPKAEPTIGHDSSRGAPPFNILVDDCFSAERVTSRWLDTVMAKTSETARLIDVAWDQAQREASALGADLYAGPLCRLLAWSMRDGCLDLWFGPTDYREFVGTNVRHPEIARRHGRAYLSNATGVCVAVISTNDRTLLQRRSERVFENPGFLHVLGGNLEPSDAADPDVAAPFAAAYRELMEELSIDPGQIAELFCLGLIEDSRTLKPELLIEARLRLSVDQLHGTDHHEFSELLVLDMEPSVIASFLAAHADQLVPGGQACLLAVGRRRFGDHWHRATVKRLTRRLT